MTLTAEQKAIIATQQDLKINAVAGSGKTSTIVAYAKNCDSSKNLLYLAFNKSVKIEATQKFNQENLQNIRVETAHSLAYKNVVRKHNYELQSNGYRSYEIVKILNISSGSQKHSDLVMANHIAKYAAMFCNSAAQKVGELNYLQTITNEESQEFVNTHHQEIYTLTRTFLAKMNSGEIPITHDFYLKKYQLTKPTLYYDYIFFDEGQDASPAMLDVFIRQRATKILVGDTHQQIYGWRNAVNSLENTDFQELRLSASFRFSPQIATLAHKILLWKKHLGQEPDVKLFGRGKHSANKVKATIARTNLGLLLRAIEFIKDNKNIKHIYFEGNLNSYTYADDGASLYDVLHLQNGKKRLVRDPIIKQMSSVDDLEEYIKQTDDVQLGLMLEIVKEYGNEIPKILQDLKDKHVANEDKHKAQMIFSTVHRCKGMEYDSVQLVNDFVGEERLKVLIEKEDADPSRLNEEINLLYVAVTRTRNHLYIPENLVPDGIGPTPSLHILKTEKKEKDSNTETDRAIRSYLKEKTQRSSVNETSKQSYQKWTKELDDELLQMHSEGIPSRVIATHFNRTTGGIRSRLKKLNGW
ncbi:MAG: F-box protein 18 (helicase) [Bacteroidia bacterium]|jgi:F-box protein 18 (helicase)